jgi:hypothetical protein
MFDIVIEAKSIHNKQCFSDSILNTYITTKSICDSFLSFGWSIKRVKKVVSPFNAYVKNIEKENSIGNI